MSLLDIDFMRRALLAALLVGLTAPAIGVYLVQRRLALLGDGIGHVTLAGVAVGFFLGTAPIATAIVAAVAGAVAIELLRTRGQTTGDVALAALFYGGIATGVLFIGLAPRASGANLLGYLFGSVTTVSPGDLRVIAVLAACVLVVVVALGRQLFVVTYDEDLARVAGLPVTTLNLVVAVTAALTVALAMRVVGILLVSALMVLPVAAAQQLARSFRGALVTSVAVGVVVAVSGLVSAYYLDVAPGATIVLLALGVFLGSVAVRQLRRA
jgi:zinc transport system permease protein